MKSLSKKFSNFVKNISKKVSNFLLDDTDGATAVEYAVMLALIIAVCILAIGAVGSAAAGHFQDSSEALNNSIGN